MSSLSVKGILDHCGEPLAISEVHPVAVKLEECDLVLIERLPGAWTAALGLQRCGQGLVRWVLDTGDSEPQRSFGYDDLDALSGAWHRWMAIKNRPLSRSVHGTPRVEARRVEVGVASLPPAQTDTGTESVAAAVSNAIDDLLSAFAVDEVDRQWSPVWCRSGKRAVHYLGVEEATEVLIGAPRPDVGAQDRWSTPFSLNGRSYEVADVGRICSLFSAVWLQHLWMSRFTPVAFLDSEDRIMEVPHAEPTDHGLMVCDEVLRGTLACHRPVALGLWRQKPGMVRWILDLDGAEPRRSIGVDDLDSLEGAWRSWKDLWHAPSGAARRREPGRAH